MKLALNGATIMRSSLADDIEIAAETGFTALEVWAGKVDDFTRRRPLADAAHKMQALGITPWCINSIENITYRDAAGRRDLLDELRRTVALAREISAPGIVVVPGARPNGFSRHESVRDAVDVLRAMSDVAEDIGLAFEFLGKPGCAVPVLGMAVDIVEAVDRPNVGMVIDTFHFHAGGSRFEDLDRVRIDRLFVVHLNGCEDLPREQLTDAHRLYPGEGVIPIGRILSRLHSRGWDGTASVEIFRPAYWEQDPREVASTAHARARAVAEAAGFTIT